MKYRINLWAGIDDKGEVFNDTVYFNRGRLCDLLDGNKKYKVRRCSVIGIEATSDKGAEQALKSVDKVYRASMVETKYRTPLGCTSSDVVKHMFDECRMSKNMERANVEVESYKLDMVNSPVRPTILEVMIDKDDKGYVARFDEKPHMHGLKNPKRTTFFPNKLWTAVTYGPAIVTVTYLAETYGFIHGCMKRFDDCSIEAAERYLKGSRRDFGLSDKKVVTNRFRGTYLAVKSGEQWGFVNRGADFKPYIDWNYGSTIERDIAEMEKEEGTATQDASEVKQPEETSEPAATTSDAPAEPAAEAKEEDTTSSGD